jgi:tetratricopeptide (TPR) repeat protein
MKLAELYERRPDSRSIAKHHRTLAHEEAGVAAYRNGRLDEALAQLQRSVDLSPDSARAWFYLAESHRARGQHPEAARAYETCLRLSRNHGRALDAISELKGNIRFRGE